MEVVDQVAVTSRILTPTLRSHTHTHVAVEGCCDLHSCACSGAEWMSSENWVVSFDFWPKRRLPEPVKKSLPVGWKRVRVDSSVTSAQHFLRLRLSQELAPGRRTQFRGHEHKKQAPDRPASERANAHRCRHTVHGCQVFSARLGCVNVLHPSLEERTLCSSAFKTWPPAKFWSRFAFVASTCSGSLREFLY